MVRLILMILVICGLFGFAYSNQDQTISLSIFWQMDTGPLPVYVIVIASFLFGTIFALMMSFPGWLRSMIEQRRQGKRIEQLEIDLDRIRSEALRSVPPPLPPTSIEEIHDDA
ncbi:MAG: LapA family protein [Nitrospira sp.]|nr:LapA family protein [Candidatus Manganitrophaceae bacterium]HIL34513.1 LapA family protein [Candidatus Manganitrophaceae bacterium]